MASMAYKLGNIELSEKKKHVEDLGHDIQHGYIYINRKIIAAVRLGGLAPARPITKRMLSIVGERELRLHSESHVATVLHNELLVLRRMLICEQ